MINLCEKAAALTKNSLMKRSFRLIDYYVNNFSRICSARGLIIFFLYPNKIKEMVDSRSNNNNICLKNRHKRKRKICNVYEIEYLPPRSIFKVSWIINEQSI